MSKLINNILNYIRPFTKYAWLVIVIILVALVAYYGYSQFAKRATIKSQYKDVANANSRGLNADIYFFHVDWCPHCKTATPEWEKFQQNYNGKSINGYTIVAHDMDCTEDSADNSNPQIAELIQKFNIQGYPTIKVTTDDGKTIDYDAKITANGLETFINTAL